METYDSWVPRVGEAIKRKNDPEAPRHLVTGIRGKGAYRTVSIDAGQKRWWATDLFEPADPVARVEAPPPPTPVIEAPEEEPLETT